MTEDELIAIIIINSVVVNGILDRAGSYILDRSAAYIEAR